MRKWVYGVGFPQGNEDIYLERYKFHNEDVLNYFKDRPGDLLVVPKDKQHRFMLTETKTIKCVRLFQDKAGWVPVYRN